MDFIIEMLVVFGVGVVTGTILRQVIGEKVGNRTHWIVPTTNSPTYYLIKRNLGGSYETTTYLGEDDRWSTQSTSATKFDSRETAQKFLKDFLTE